MQDRIERQSPDLPKQTVNALSHDTITAIPGDSLSTDALANDTVPNDSLNSNAIDAPINYEASDSIVTTLKDGNLIRLYGNAKVTYKDLELTGEYIEIDADKNLVFATFALDSIGDEFGYPVFKDAGNQYEMKRMWYNFKTKTGYISEVITEQGEGYVTAQKTKKMGDDVLFMRDGKYTTCDEHDHPHFYFNLTKAKVRPKKNIVTGPAYLVLEDVPLPIFVPFAFFPFTSDYSSGIIPPSYGDEMTRGFSLRDGGYYFAFNDYVDLALTGEIYTKGSWGLNARSSYRKRYKFSGGFNSSYIVTKVEDVSTTKDFRIAWNHSQDPKANPFQTFSAGVDFATSSYNKNSVTQLYGPNATDNTKSSSINFTKRFPGSPLSISLNATVNQQSRDTSLSMTLPNMTVTMSEIYPFRRKEQIGNPRWYEAIRLSYTGLFMNSISNVKEYDFMKKNLIRDWRNGMKHDIPISASFNLLKYIIITPNVNYTSRWYTTKIDQEYDRLSQRVVPSDTTYGFYRIYDYRGGVSMNTKLYGFFKPWGIFGNWAKNTTIRHVITPSISFSGAPDFGDPSYGFYKELRYYDPNKMNVDHMDTVVYSPYSNGLWGVPGRGKTGSLSFRIENNVEAKVNGQDTTKKYSIIDNLGLGMSYNLLADSMKWSNLSASLRLKLSRSFTLNLQGTFDTYTYNEKGVRIDVPRWEVGKGIGRLISTGSSFSYSLNNDVIKKWFGKGSDDSGTKKKPEDDSLDSEDDGEEMNVEQTATEPKSLRTKKTDIGDFDSDGYLVMNIPWNLSFNYSLSLGYDNANFNTKTREYGYKITQTLGLSGNLTPTKGWNFNFNTSYDFDYKKFAYMQCSLTRNLHCWQMTASIIPLGPYQSYSFTISVNSSLLKDFKYTQSSNYRDAQRWE
ncbi:MAG: LPS-assembly protein LptD [Dysgonamonadaceae bacterium]|nr:LPS-assembly protein LptD [Dysgonamonadaceae bacterium]